MNTLSITPVAVSAVDSKRAAALVAEYRSNGNGSNRANWERIQIVLSAVLAVIRTGSPVEITAAFAGESGKSPAYNVAHRQLSAGVIRPNWENVQIVALVDVRQNGKNVTGTPSSTATFARSPRVFICPAE